MSSEDFLNDSGLRNEILLRESLLGELLSMEHEQGELSKRIEEKKGAIDRVVEGIRKAMIFRNLPTVVIGRRVVTLVKTYPNTGTPIRMIVVFVTGHHIKETA